jgi:ribose-phosphate pyrophosphokinase
MIIIPGPASLDLGSKIAEKLEVKSYPVDHRIFPDGESYIKISPNVENEIVSIIQTTAPEPDRKLIQLLIMSKTIKDFGANRIILVVPYLAYSRQDKRFLKGEALTLDVILALFEKVGVSDLVVVDIHNERSLQEVAVNNKISVHNLSAVPAMAEYLKTNGYKGAYSLSPDKGAVHLAQESDLILKGGYGFFEKSRDRRTGDIEMKVKGLNVSGKKAVVLDDIISSGGTMAKAVKGLIEQGAVKIAAASSHALFIGDAIKKLNKAGADMILSTDTVMNPYSKVSIAHLVAEYLGSI